MGDSGNKKTVGLIAEDSRGHDQRHRTPDMCNGFNPLLCGKSIQEETETNWFGW